MPQWLAPLLLAAYPVVLFYARNAGEVAPRSILLPLAACLGLGGIVWLVVRSLAANRAASASIACLWLAILLGYGHVVTLLEAAAGHPFPLHRHLQLLLGLVLLGGYASYALVRLHRGVDRVPLALVVGTAALLALNVPAIAGHWLQQLRAQPARTEPAERLAAHVVARDAAPAVLPDIYLIILDEYAGARTMQELFGYDNSAFERALSGYGFVIPARPRGIAYSTVQVMASILNLEYAPATEVNLLAPHVRDNLVVAFLKDRGYQIRYYPSFHYYDQLAPMKRADLNADPWQATGTSRGLGDFTYEFLRTTVLRVALREAAESRTGGLITPQYTNDSFARYTDYIFEHVAEASTQPGPVFTYAHVTCPHLPYVFDENGNRITGSDPAAGYLGQHKYVSKKTLRLVDRILAGSTRPVVILIESDHGPRGPKVGSVGGQERHWRDVLTAYRVPGVAALPQDLSPVNSFRLVFNRYFGTDYPMLTAPVVN